ncbi:hypothetical protein [Psychromicrobium lacuslunae]|uniref:Uncharacterized protein n=1 Tax=Psychromicrobium lacuslunae TaxID=1618207 RepID=A0A0D4C1I5_9MICC|nr:hypothetical protein [Psychromicrobium lacuslunae]AJT42424.1 hypothetical protein UM93_14630 [Psychromicrobium lacuslunae]
MSLVVSALKGQAQGFGVTGQIYRNALAAMVQSNGLAVVGGVASGCTVANTSGMSGTVSQGRMVVPAASTAQGAYVVTITQDEPFSVGTSDATRNRIDRLIAQVTDPDAIGGAGTPSAVITVLPGAYPASGSPVPPLTPAGALSLGTIPVPAGATSWTVQDKAAQLYGLPGQWRPGQRYASHAQKLTVTVTSGQQIVNAFAGFPVGRFTVPPLLSVTLSSLPTGMQRFDVSVRDATTEGVWVMLTSKNLSGAPNNFTITVDVEAFQMTPTSAEG